MKTLAYYLLGIFPGRNPENRAGLTPAWCNFVNPFFIMLNVKC